MPFAARTLADVIAALSHLPDLNPRTRLDLASAVRTFCKVTGLDLAATDAGDLAALQARLAAVRARKKAPLCRLNAGPSSAASF